MDVFTVGAIADAVAISNGERLINIFCIPSKTVMRIMIFEDSFVRAENGAIFIEYEKNKAEFTKDEINTFNAIFDRIEKGF